MRFIKKLVILTGSGARGTLMLEKNGYGVWCKLSLFDFRLSGNVRLIVIAGDDLYCIKVDDKNATFELGEMNFDEIHAAIVTDKVLMYGSNCAGKLAPDVIMNRLRRADKIRAEEGSLITFSGRDKKIEDYFKEIAPPEYNDFALAEKNYYPAYVTLLDENADKTADSYAETENSNRLQNGADFETQTRKKSGPKAAEPENKNNRPQNKTDFETQAREGSGTKETEPENSNRKQNKADSETQAREGSGPKAAEPEKSNRQQNKAERHEEDKIREDLRIYTEKRERKAEENKKDTSVWGDLSVHQMTPHELEQKYLRLIAKGNEIPEKEDAKIKEAASTTKNDDTVTEITITELPRREAKSSSAQSVTEAEKPEVIAMARRITLRDYRVKGAQPMGRRATFFERSSAQLNKLMTTSERFPIAERLIPGSKFVKINYDNRRYYVVGVIGNDYICYGVPAMYTDEPPEPFKGYARWLPFDEANYRGEGLWMMYQDGVSGETLKNMQKSR